MSISGEPAARGAFTMVTMTTNNFALRPLTPAVAADLRQKGGEIYVADDDGYPCRQCLRDAEVGEELILVSHDPFTTDSPYRSSSPVFVHRHDCSANVVGINSSAADVTAAPLPRQLTRRRLSVRSFDTSAMMIDAAVINGTDLASTIASLFAAPDAHRLHVHNAGRGCFAVAVDRVSA
jgi:hypothetical protein